MHAWVLYAVLAMLFAGVTPVLAKLGLQGISGELGLAVRTLFVCVFVLGFSLALIPVQAVSALKKEHWLWLGLSGCATALSWLFYFKALKAGEVSSVALIDKASVVVAVILSALLLKEVITPKVILGGTLMLAGLLLIATK